MTIQSKDATKFTKEANAAILKELPFDDKQDFEDAQRGFIATVQGDGIYNDKGDHLIWDLKSYEYQKIGAPCPDTINPSLWRQAQLNNIHGLFKVMDRVHQARNLDMGNMTIIEGDTGLIVIDCTTSDETAKACMKLYRDNVNKKPIKAIVITHSHTDHYGGIRGLISEEDVKSGKVQIYVPDNFLFEVVSENAYVGNIMSRRTYDQYGTILPKNAKAQVDDGLGKGMGSGGTHSILPPTYIVKKDVEDIVIDGVTFEFMQTPHTEAPSEMIMYFPQFKLLLPGEIITHTFHNLYTLRGTEVRDARMWWKSVDRMIETYADKTEVICAVHHWPTWGKDRCRAFLELQRDSYKYMHDQCLRLMNLGYTSLEVAEMMVLPDALGKKWAMRGYYGTWNHDAKAVYQKYLGFFDMVPANLHPLPPEDAAKKYVEFGGGSKAVLAKTKEAFDKGEYRWAAEIGNRLVFAEPKNVDALNMLADIYEQLGYQCECGTWRCVYLMGALELRLAAVGKSANPTTSTINPDLTNVMDDEMFFDFMAAHLNAPKVGDETIIIDFEQTDRKTTWALRIQNGVLNFHKDKKYPKFDAKVKLSRDDFSHLILGLDTVDGLVKKGNVKIDGDAKKVQRFFDVMDKFTLDINIMTP
ncbi:putative alkyl/aryl-sulfatase YjcS [Methanosarcinaceae archaeon Ag5]|uniref:Alkyl/aryl-sulfatase YjcS n=1 Tax=Methanolapillus africanus TaxID=3028297 RepID=A0AAE4SCT4_9EURY|nr:putative alkyl/aryl-sulfatase YjcS [Methanosarcinaceae archaeon Ag5]